MRFVALNTAGPITEVVAVHDDFKRFFKADKGMASERLLCALDDMLIDARLTLSDFDDFVCVVGPGSFTGIRIGINTVRAFAYALGKNAYGVTYDRVIAYSSEGRVTTFIDGGGPACYAAVYDGDETVTKPFCMYKKDCASFGEGERIADFDMGAKKYEADGESLIKAATLAIKNKWGTDPVYLRKPQPERKEYDI